MSPKRIVWIISYLMDVRVEDCGVHVCLPLDNILWGEQVRNCHLEISDLLWQRVFQSRELVLTRDPVWVKVLCDSFSVETSTLYGTCLEISMISEDREFFY